MTTLDTGERRRNADARPLITALIDEATVEAIAGEAWIALVGEDEVLVPVPTELPADTTVEFHHNAWAAHPGTARSRKRQVVAVRSFMISRTSLAPRRFPGLLNPVRPRARCGGG